MLDGLKLWKVCSVVILALGTLIGCVRVGGLNGRGLSVGIWIVLLR